MLEATESFNLTIDQNALPSNVIAGDIDQTSVTIVDDDGKLIIMLL